MLKNKLRHIDLRIKSSLLLLIGISLFPFLKSETYIAPYSIYLLSITLLLALLYYKVSSWKSLTFVLKLWLIGLVFYGIFALVFVLNNWNISPTIELTETKYTILYLLIYPIRVLAVFFSGLSFIEIVSPIEFLKYGRLGHQLCFLMRSFQVAKEQMMQNKKAMEMMGELPDTFKSFKDYQIFVKKSPLIIALTIRNLMVWLFWAAHQFELFKKGNNKK
ncbi:MAG TPA: hypothetical protein PKZ69_04230 [Candidatus Cloacimonadota bacterium]|nr:hypothetical protein [Candidatus Cloacimonadota bacterium]HPK40809.1 hypothetical protein [Candidatus Cloacimonadota bacterium]